MNAFGAVRFTCTIIHEIATLKQIALLTKYTQFEGPAAEIFRGTFLTRARTAQDRLERLALILKPGKEVSAS